MSTDLEQDKLRAIRGLADAFVGTGRGVGKLGPELVNAGRRLRQAVRGDVRTLRQPIDEVRGLLVNLSTALDEVLEIVDQVISIVGVDN